MEENYKNDRLDDFVRKSFDAYEESPSPGLWDRIETGLAPAVADTPRSPSQHWILLALLALTLGGLLLQHFYFSKKLERLEEKIDKLVAAPPLSQAEKPAIGESLAAQAMAALPTPPRTFTKKAMAAGSAVSGQGALSDPRIVENPAPRTTIVSGEAQAAPAPDFSEKNASDKLGLTESPISATPGILPEKFEKHAVFLQKMPDLPLLRRFQGGFFSFTENPSLGFLPLVRPAKNASGWYIGLQVMPYFTFEKKGSSEIPHGPGGPRPVLASRQSGADFNTDFWLKTGKRIGRHFSIETGLGFAHIARSATHTPRFTLKDGSPYGGPGHGGPGHGGHDFEFDFDYSLQTYGGSASVSLRMEQVDSTATYSDDEELDFSITTCEQTKMLKIPLLAGFHFGRGRLQGVVRGGLVGQFVLKNSLGIVGMQTPNGHFRQHRSDKSGARFSFPEKFKASLMLSAGAEFRLSKRLSLGLEPTFFGELKNAQPGNPAVPSHFSTGVSGGVFYRF